MKKHTIRLGVCLLLMNLVTLASACRLPFGPGLAGTPCPVAWVPSEAIDPEISSIRARVHLKVAGKEIHLELITQGQPDELVVIGLARFGVRLFAVHQSGSVLRVEGASSPELEQIAIWVMDALHRSLWILPPSDPKAPTAKSWLRSGERVIETQRLGGLRRQFFVLDSLGGSVETGTPPVTIDYLDAPGLDPNLDPGARASTLSIRNPWCGYEAMIAPL